MTNTIRIKRRASGAAGAPSTLANAELAYNEVDDTLYYGKGTGGAGGSATTAVPIAGSGAYVGLTGNQTIAGTKTFSSPITASVAGNASTATALATARTLSYTGDATGSATFDGTANTATTLTLGTTGVTAGTYASVTVNAKGQVTAGTNPTTLAGHGITDAVNVSTLGAVNGVATLGSDGKVPAGQLPSFVDDVLEFAALANFPATGESSKIYTALDTNKIYRWSGSVYIEISSTAGNADSATKLATPRTITATGDATWSVSFDGSANASAALTLAASGVTAGTYGSATTVPVPVVNSKGLITAITTQAIAFPVTSVANRTGAITLAAGDISGLGTMAVQNAAVVAITGGTIDGVVFDGGTF